jgi:hypothetical protein
MINHGGHEVKLTRFERTLKKCTNAKSPVTTLETAWSISNTNLAVLRPGTSLPRKNVRAVVAI